MMKHYQQRLAQQRHQQQYLALKFQAKNDTHLPPVTETMTIMHCHAGLCTREVRTL
jgi:hypothetical protein